MLVSENQLRQTHSHLHSNKAYYNNYLLILSFKCHTINKLHSIQFYIHFIHASLSVVIRVFMSLRARIIQFYTPFHGRGGGCVHPSCIIQTCGTYSIFRVGFWGVGVGLFDVQYLSNEWYKFVVLSAYVFIIH